MTIDAAGASAEWGRRWARGAQRRITPLTARYIPANPASFTKMGSAPVAPQPLSLTEKGDRPMIDLQRVTMRSKGGLCAPWPGAYLRPVAAAGEAMLRYLTLNLTICILNLKMIINRQRRKLQAVDFLMLQMLRSRP